MHLQKKCLGQKCHSNLPRAVSLLYVHFMTAVHLSIFNYSRSVQFFILDWTETNSELSAVQMKPVRGLFWVQ
jgi:hypothetical protein